MNILIIEDNPNIAYILKSQLKKYDHKVQRITSDNFSKSYLEDQLYELILIDTHLDNPATEIIKNIRRFSLENIILGLASKGGWKEKVEMLKSGADDVIGYPFPPQELEARLQALKKRPKRVMRNVMQIKDITIDTNIKEVSKKDSQIPLRKKEYQLLEYLVMNKNRTVTRSELSDHVWDYRHISGSNTIDVHINRLRDSLKDPDIIKTIRGFGYTIKDKQEASYIRDL